MRKVLVSSPGFGSGPWAGTGKCRGNSEGEKCYKRVANCIKVSFWRPWWNGHFRLIEVEVGDCHQPQFKAGYHHFFYLSRLGQNLLTWAPLVGIWLWDFLYNSGADPGWIDAGIILSSPPRYQALHFLSLKALLFLATFVFFSVTGVKGLKQCLEIVAFLVPLEAEILICLQGNLVIRFQFSKSRRSGC